MSEAKIPRRTFIFSQLPLDEEDITNIATALEITEDTEFIHPDPNITIDEIDTGFEGIDDVIFADTDTHSLYNLTELLDQFKEFLELYAAEGITLSEAALDYLMVE